MVNQSLITALYNALIAKFENKTANKKDDISGDFSSDNVSYPTVRSVKNWVTSAISGKEDKSNKVTSLSSSSTNTQYPSAKCVNDELEYKSDIDHTHPVDNQWIQESTNPVESRVISAEIFDIWDSIAGKSSSDHNHDSRYYTETEIDNLGIEYIAGTHGTSATPTWTGRSTKISSLKSGQVIFFKMTSAGTSSGNTLNLTLKDGTSTTGAKNIYYRVGTKLTTHYPANSVLCLVYDGTQWIVASAVQDTNQVDRLLYTAQIVANASAKLIKNGLVCGKSDGLYYNVGNAGTLDIRHKILMAGAEVAVNANSNNVYSVYSDVNLTTTKSGVSLAKYKRVYIEGTALSGSTFTISSNVFKDDSSLVNGNYYIPIGYTHNSNTNIRFNCFENIVFHYTTSKGLVPMGLSYNDLLDKPTIPNVSGKEDKSNKVTSLSSSSTDTQYPSAKCVYDELIYKSDIDHTHTIDNQFIQESTNPVESRVISAAIFALEDAIAGKASSSHSHTTAQVKDSSAYSNLGTSANATQATINSAINTKIGALLSVELVTVVSSLPTASASTMNKLYLTPESTSATNDKYKIYVTVKNGNTYAWEKVDTARIDLSNYTTFSNVDSEIDAYLSALITALES